MRYKGILTPEQARELGITESTTVISSVPSQQDKKPNSPTGKSSSTTEQETPPAWRSKIRSAPPDAPIFSLGFVIGEQRLKSATENVDNPPEKMSSSSKVIASDWKALAANGWTLLDVEEKAVALSPNLLEAICFDPEARPFPAASACWNGCAATQEEFSALVEADRCRKFGKGK